MWNLTCKIYLAANATITLFLLVFLFFSPLVFFFGIVISLLISLPAIPALYGVFRLIQQRAVPPGPAWVLLVLTVLAVSLLPFCLLTIAIGESLFGDGLFLALSIIAGLGGICFHISSIHYFFQKVASNAMYEND